MFSIFSNSGEIKYGQKEFILDFESDIKDLPTNITPGSIAFIIENSKYFMLNHQKQWVSVKLNNGSESGGSSTVDKVIYNGGTV